MAYNLQSTDVDPESTGDLLTETSERILKKAMLNKVQDSTIIIC
jgi:hypothetical protein